MTKDLLNAYRHFRRAGIEHIVGRNAAMCLDLARAEIIKTRLINSNNLKIDWISGDNNDGPSEWGWDDNQIKRWDLTDHYCEVCILELNGEHIASLGGIWDADNDYQREIEAQLMLESLPLTRLGLRFIAK